MSRSATDKHKIANQIAAFMNNHGSEETGKLLCRVLLSIAEASNASEIQFSDSTGEVHVRAFRTDDNKLH